MISFTYCLGKKCFFIILATLAAGLAILKFLSPHNSSTTAVKKVQNITTLKNIYSAFTKKNFSEVRVSERIFQVTGFAANKEDTFNDFEITVAPFEKYYAKIPGIKLNIKIQNPQDYETKNTL